jgi:hypothetical protein
LHISPSNKANNKIFIFSDPVREIKVTPLEHPHYPGYQFKCEAQGNPAPAYQWAKVNGTQTLKVDGNILTIPNDATEEILFYKCAAFNTPASSEVQISYALTVNITGKFAKKIRENYHEMFWISLS